MSIVDKIKKSAEDTILPPWWVLAQIAIMIILVIFFLVSSASSSQPPISVAAPQYNPTDGTQTQPTRTPEPDPSTTTEPSTGTLEDMPVLDVTALDTTLTFDGVKAAYNSKDVPYAKSNVAVNVDSDVGFQQLVDVNALQTAVSGAYGLMNPKYKIDVPYVAGSTPPEVKYSLEAKNLKNIKIDSIDKKSIDFIAVVQTASGAITQIPVTVVYADAAYRIQP